MNNDRFDVSGVMVSNVRGVDVLNGIDNTVRSGKKEIFAYVNVHAVNMAKRLPWFRDFLNNAKIAYADGEGLRLGASILGFSLPEKIALTRKIWDVASLCEEKGYSLYLLGSTGENVKRAADNLTQRYPRLQIHTHHGYFTDEENENVLKNIQSHAPNVFIVGFGMPKQEQWILKNIDRLNVNAILPGGACIDFAAGAMPVCPMWISRIGFEWLFRFFFEPRRLFYRYFAGNPVFLLRIIFQRIRNGKYRSNTDKQASYMAL